MNIEILIIPIDNERPIVPREKVINPRDSEVLVPNSNKLIIVPWYNIFIVLYISLY